MNTIKIIYTALSIALYIAFGLSCLYVGYKKGSKKGYYQGASFICDKMREIINSTGNDALDPEFPDISDVPLIGSTVYSILPNDIDDDGGGYHIEPWTVYGSGITKSGEIYVLSFDKELYILDDEEEGLSFSTLEKAQQHLKNIQERNEK